MFFVFAMAAMIGCGFAGPVADDGQTFAAARKLADDGRVEEAFRAFAAMPGGEYAAAAVARGEAAKFLSADSGGCGADGFATGQAD